MEGNMSEGQTMEGQVMEGETSEGHTTDIYSWCYHFGFLFVLTYYMHLFDIGDGFSQVHSEPSPLTGNP